MVYAKVAVSEVSFSVDRPYDYSVPASMADKIQPGMRVIIPFSRSNRRAEGIVLSLSNTSNFDSPKEILQLLDQYPVITKDLLQLSLWMRERYFCTAFDAIKAMLPVGLFFNSNGRRKVSDKYTEYLSLIVSGEEAVAIADQKSTKSKMQSSVLKLMSVVGFASTSDVRSLTGASKKTIQSLVEENILSFSYRETFRRPNFIHGADAQSLPFLNHDQENAYLALQSLAFEEKAQAALLYGVTGSGKTAVYISLIHVVLEKGESAILLVPEIALTPQMLETFSSYFGDKIAVLHSSLSIAERYDEWKRIKNGIAKLVIGTRSAIFAPVDKLGLIIIDEEQEDTYKSENNPRYHAKEIAKYRCSQSNSLLVFGSATPDIETRYYADIGRYKFYSLPLRYNQLPLPDVHIVDMKEELRNGNSSSISSYLRQALIDNINAGEQSILFLNRRGSSKLVTCTNCGFHYSCPNCSVNLTYHSGANKLICHSCGYSMTPKLFCPECGGELRFMGDGTEKIESQLKELFPEVSCIRLDTDTVREAGGHDSLLRKFESNHIPIMIGTQMVTKGLNFENVTLVGVLQADLSLFSGNYRAAEHCFSLITQVIGRSGRAEKKGRAVIQSFSPENPVIQLSAAQDYDAFYHYEINLRKLQRCPPFVGIVILSIVGKNELNVIKCSENIKQLLLHALAEFDDIDVLGPAPFPVVKVAGQFRYRITIRGGNDAIIRSVVTKILNYCNTQRIFRGISVYADRNPLE